MQNKMILFTALQSTIDGRLTNGQVYIGTLVYIPKSFFKRQPTGYGLRVAVYDNKSDWMTFNPKVFRPYIGPVVTTQELAQQKFERKSHVPPLAKKKVSEVEPNKQAEGDRSPV